MANFIEKLLCPSVEGQQQGLKDVKKRLDDLEQNLVCMWRASEAKLQKQIVDRYAALESIHTTNTDCLSMLERRLSDNEQLTDSTLRSLRSLASKVENLKGLIAASEQPVPAVQLDKPEVTSSFVEEKLRKLTHNQDHYEGLLRNMQGELLDLKRSYKQEAPSTMFQSGKSQLASDTLEDEEATADGIKFEGEKGIEYVIGLIEERGEAKKLLQAQQRMINRLYKLAVTTVEDPGKSITEELRKAEKWKKTLRKKLKAFEEV